MKYILLINLSCILFLTISSQLYALLNHSGHTAIQPVILSYVCASCMAICLALSPFCGTRRRKRCFNLIILIGAFGIINPPIMGATGILQQYDSWCKTGMVDFGLSQFALLLLLVGSSVALGVLLWRFFFATNMNS